MHRSTNKNYYTCINKHAEKKITLISRDCQVLEGLGPNAVDENKNK